MGFKDKNYVVLLSGNSQKGNNSLVKKIRFLSDTSKTRNLNRVAFIEFF